MQGRWNTYTAVVVCLGLLVGVTGCLTVMKETAMKAMEDRTTDDQVTNTKISTGILSRLSDKDSGLLLDVNVDVWEQRVLLTGTLDNPAVRGDVVKLVREDTRMTAVYDEIQIVTPEEKE